MAKPKTDLVTIKVTRTARKNFRIAASIAGIKLYQAVEEGSCFVMGKYNFKKQKKDAKSA